MQRCGAEGHVCKDGQHRSPGGEDFLACPVCEQKDAGCGYCGGFLGGLVRVGCVNLLVTQDVWDLIDAAELVEKSGWGGANGWKDEPMPFVDGVLRVWGEHARIRAALYKKD